MRMSIRGGRTARQAYPWLRPPCRCCRRDHPRRGKRLHRKSKGSGYQGGGGGRILPGRHQFNAPELLRAEAACRAGRAADLPSSPALAGSSLPLPLCFLPSVSDTLAFGDAVCLAAVVAPGFGAPALVAPAFVASL